MTSQNDITDVIESLEQLASISPTTSERANRGAKEKAQSIIRQSALDQDTIKSICSVIAKTANPSGWYYDTNGIKAGLTALQELVEAVQAKEVQASEPFETPIHTGLRNIAFDAALYAGTLIKLTTKTLRSIAYKYGLHESIESVQAGFVDKVSNGIRSRWKAYRGTRALTKHSIPRGA